MGETAGQPGGLSPTHLFQFLRVSAMPRLENEALSLEGLWDSDNFLMSDLHMPRWAKSIGDRISVGVLCAIAALGPPWGWKAWVPGPEAGVQGGCSLSKHLQCISRTGEFGHS